MANLRMAMEVKRASLVQQARISPAQQLPGEDEGGQGVGDQHLPFGGEMVGVGEVAGAAGKALFVAGYRHN